MGMLSLVRYHAFSSIARGFIIDEKHRERGSHTVSGSIPTSPLDAVTCHSEVCLVVFGRHRSGQEEGIDSSDFRFFLIP
ncbi:hypothetical protein FJTKL_12411 [Diaporthe vaccinii]|uniref:Uncharacterized protein n=1 Tax=Diaporthe vaccinii TaxID=105482 RepID=A0ABR4EEH3_9PEZI